MWLAAFESHCSKTFGKLSWQHSTWIISLATLKATNLLLSWNKASLLQSCTVIDSTSTKSAMLPQFQIIFEATPLYHFSCRYCSYTFTLFCAYFQSYILTYHFCIISPIKQHLHLQWVHAVKLMYMLLGYDKQYF